MGFLKIPLEGLIEIPLERLIKIPLEGNFFRFPRESERTRTRAVGFLKTPEIPLEGNFFRFPREAEKSRTKAVRFLKSTEIPLEGLIFHPLHVADWPRVWLVGDFLYDCMFWENSGGGLTTQPVGTATMTTVTSANCVDLESFSSRCWTFRRTHTSADPIRVLCTGLALPLTLSLPSRLAPRTKLMVGVSPRALWLAGIFLRRKKRCAGVIGTRNNWALKGEEGGMMTPLLQCVARFDGGVRDFWV